jgi:hypothetical protein
MNCPVCNGEMYDNRTTKKNPKAPDYRCKDKECKYSYNKVTKEYEPSEYGTGAWEQKQGFQKKPLKSVPQEKVEDNNKEVLYSTIVSINGKLTKIYNAVDKLLRLSGKTITEPNGEEVIKNDWTKEDLGIEDPEE